MRFLRRCGRLLNAGLAVVGLKVIRQAEGCANPVNPVAADTSATLQRLRVDVAELLRAGRPIKLHVGCGPRILKGWLNIDLSYEPCEAYLQYYGGTHYPPEVRGSLSEFYPIDVSQTRLPIPDGTVDVIAHEDFIEHLSQKDQVAFLAEAFRILKKGGVHRVNTPNLLVSLRDRYDFSRGSEGVYREAWAMHGHVNILSPRLLEDLARWIGYREVVVAHKNQSRSGLLYREYRPDPRDSSEDENLYADLVK